VSSHAFRAPLPPSPTRVAESVVLLLPLRLALGGLFVLAALTKIADPQEFVFNLNAYGVFDEDAHAHLIKVLGFAIPWAEMLTGAALMLGLWARGAAALLAVQLLAFTLGIVNVIASGKSLSCGCFGGIEFLSNICPGDIGWCHVIRNAVLFAISLLFVWRGAGALSVDGALTRPPRPVDDDDDDD